jgi:hypothetical protein
VTGAFNYLLNHAGEVCQHAGGCLDAAEQKTDYLGGGRVSKTQTVSVILPEGHDYMVIEVEAYSEGNSMSYGRVVPGVGPKIIKPAGNAVSIKIHRLVGGGSQTVISDAFKVEIGEHTQRFYAIRSRDAHHITLKGVTYAPAGVDLRGHNYYPQAYLYGAGSN